jgi:hypothetical protein
MICERGDKTVHGATLLAAEGSGMEAEWRGAIESQCAETRTNQSSEHNWGH